MLNSPESEFVDVSGSTRDVAAFEAKNLRATDVSFHSTRHQDLPRGEAAEVAEDAV